MRQKPARRLRLCFAIATIVACTAIPQSAGKRASANSLERRQSRTLNRRVRIAQLRNVDELKEVFQRDFGKVRLVVLVSPT
jgi:hypothetical protein